MEPKPIRLRQPRIGRRSLPCHQFIRGPIAMNYYIKSIEVLGLHRRFDMRMEFSEGVNIVYGVNGAGKTTLLHILANAANFDLERFTTLAFRSISMKISDGSEIVISAEPGQDRAHLERITVRVDEGEVVTLHHREALAERGERRWDSEIRRIQDWKRHLKVPMEVTYFPAFRTMSEAWSSLDLLTPGLVFVQHPAAIDTQRYALPRFHRRDAPARSLSRCTSPTWRRWTTGPAAWSRSPERRLGPVALAGNSPHSSRWLETPPCRSSGGGWKTRFISPWQDGILLPIPARGAAG